MSTFLDRDKLESLVFGSSFFGGGGGGSQGDGMILLAKMFEENPEARVEMIEVCDMEEGSAATMCAALGSPVATKGKLFEEEAQNAILGMKEEAKAHGKELKYVYSGEQGGANTMLPIYAAWKLGMPILNTDGNGRAVPALDTGLQPIYDIPTSPVILASDLGDTIIGRTKDPLDCKGCENIARYMCQAYNMGIGFAAWIMDKAQLEKASAIGQIDRTIAVGEILKSNGPDTVLTKLEKYFGKEKYKTAAVGEIIKIEMDVAGGFDKGVVVVKGDDGKEYRTMFLNENLVSYDSEGKVVATVPSIISVLNLEKEGFCEAMSNSEVREGMRVAVTVTKADDRWYAVDRGYSCWNEILVAAGYCMADKQVIL